MSRWFAGAAVCLAVLACAGPSTAAAESTGAFTKAEATADWSHGSFSGSATWTDCNAECAGYVIVVYAMPSSYSCNSDTWLRRDDPNVQQIWNSSGQRVNETVAVEAKDVRLKPGVATPLLCMIGAQSDEIGPEAFVGSYKLLAQTEFALVPAQEAAPLSAPAPVLQPVPAESKACELARKRLGRLRGARRSARLHQERKRTRKLSSAIHRALKARSARCPQPAT